MKMTKRFFNRIVAAIAAVASVSSLSAFSVSAESAYALGDVDMDGVITGHDSALVSHYLNVDTDSLTTEQYNLADMNQDGIVDQSDADAIHAEEVYRIGDVDLDGEVAVFDAYYLMMFYASTAVGAKIEVVDPSAESATNWISQIKKTDVDAVDANVLYTIDQVTLNLMDCNIDGKISLMDAQEVLCAYANCAAAFGEDMAYYPAAGRYDLVW